jgi:U3 small nucleolar RNA-associated protein 20
MYFAKFGAANSSLLPVALAAIKQVLTRAAPEADTEVAWQTAYFAVELYSQIIMADVAIDDAGKLWTLVGSCGLLFPHAWVRLACSRLYGTLFSKMGDDIDQAILPVTATKFMRQIGAPNLTEELAVQAVKNLVFIVSQWAKSETNPEIEAESDSESEPEPESERHSSQPTHQVPVGGGTAHLVRKASVILRREDPERVHLVSKKAAVQFVASVVQVLSADAVTALAEEIVHAMFAYSTSELDRDKELRDLCAEALQLLQSKLGTTVYVGAYKTVQQRVTERRAERRAKKAIQAVAQPEVYARRKIKKNLHKREKRRMNQREASGLYRAKKRRTTPSN